MKTYDIENFVAGFDDSVSEEFAGSNTTQDTSYVDYSYEIGAMQKDTGERIVGITSISMSTNYPFTGTVQRLYEGNIAVTDAGDFEDKRICIADGKVYQFCAGNQFIPMESGTQMFSSIEIPEITHFRNKFYIAGGYSYPIREWDGLTNVLATANISISAGVTTSVGLGTGTYRYRAKCIEAFKDYLFIGNTAESQDSGATWTVSESRARWCKLGNPTIWDTEDDASTMNDAGYVDCVDRAGNEIVKLYSYADSLLIFKKNSIQKLSYTGGSIPFERSELDTKCINVAPWTIDQGPMGVLFLTNEGLQRTDGNIVEAMPEDTKVTTILRRAYKDSLGLAFGMTNETMQEYWLALPLDGSATCNYIITYNWKYKTWKVRETDSSCLGLFTNTGSGTWQGIIDYYGYELIAYQWNDARLYPGSKRVMMGKADGYVKEKSIAFNIDGAAYDSYHNSPWINLNENGSYKEVIKVQPMWQGTAGDSVTVKVKSDTDTAWTTVTSDDFAATGITEQPFLWLRKLGRKFKFRFENNNANENYRVYKMKIFFEERDWR